MSVIVWMYVCVFNMYDVMRQITSYKFENKLLLEYNIQKTISKELFIDFIYKIIC